MITEALFKDKLKETYILLGIDYGAGKQEATARAMLEKVQKYYTDEDLSRALDEIVEKNIQKLNYPVLVQHLRKFKAMRTDADIQRTKYELNSDPIGTVDPNVTRLVKGLVEKSDIILAEFGIDLNRPYLKNNAVIIGKDGKQRNVCIDHSQPGIEKGFTQLREISADGRVIYRTRINTEIVKCREIVDIEEDQEGWEH